MFIHKSGQGQGLPRYQVSWETGKTSMAPHQTIHTKRPPRGIRAFADELHRKWKRLLIWPQRVGASCRTRTNKMQLSALMRQSLSPFPALLCSIPRIWNGSARNATSWHLRERPIERLKLNSVQVQYPWLITTRVSFFFVVHEAKK